MTRREFRKAQKEQTKELLEKRESFKAFSQELKDGVKDPDKQGVVEAEE